MKGESAALQGLDFFIDIGFLFTCKKIVIYMYLLMVLCFLISELDADMEKMDKEAGNSFCAFENVRDVVKLFFLSWWDGVYSK